MEKLGGVLVGSGGIIMLLSLILGFIVFPSIIQNKITSQVQLAEGTKTFEKWSEMKVPIFIKFHYYNITNPTEVEKGQNPKFHEIGPYTYQERREKNGITFSKDKTTVKFREKIFYYFRPDLSTGTEDDVVNFLNIPYLVIVTSLGAYSPIHQHVGSQKVAQHNEQLIIQRKMGEILFEGYHQPMIAAIEKETNKTILKNQTFGLFYPKNGSDQGQFEIFTGTNDSSLFGEVLKWNNETDLPFWPEKETNYCNMINGTESSLFPPFLTRDSVLRLFSPDLCRSIYMKYDRETEFLGIPGYKFSLPDAILEDGRINRDNACFLCKKHEEEVEESEEVDDFFKSSDEQETPKKSEPVETCFDPGTIPLASCRKGAPIVMSNPHFYNGAPALTNNIEGISPADKETHLTFLEVEPLTGLMLQISKRLQLNVEIKKSRRFENLNRLKHMIFPILWLEESAQLSEETAEKLKGTLLARKQQVDMGKWFGVGFGAIVLMSGLLVIFLRARKKMYHV